MGSGEMGSHALEPLNAFGHVSPAAPSTTRRMKLGIPGTSWRFARSPCLKIIFASIWFKVDHANSSNTLVSAVLRLQLTLQRMAAWFGFGWNCVEHIPGPPVGEVNGHPLTSKGLLMDTRNPWCW